MWTKGQCSNHLFFIRSTMRRESIPLSTISIDHEAHMKSLYLTQLAENDKMMQYKHS